MEATPTDLNISIEGEAARASQLLEIINGDALIPPERTEELEMRDLWPVEMGDDSVFYSDEEQARQDREAVSLCAISANECKRLVNSVADYEADRLKEDHPREEMTYREGVVWTEEANTKLQTEETRVQPWKISGGSDVDPDMFGRTCERFPPPAFTALNKQTQYVQQDSPAKSNHQVKEGMKKEARSRPDPYDVPNEVLYKDGEHRRPKRVLLLNSRNQMTKQLETDLESKCNFQVNSSFLKTQTKKPNAQLNQTNLSAAPSTTSPPLNTARCRTAGSKGNTRQKTEELENVKESATSCFSNAQYEENKVCLEELLLKEHKHLTCSRKIVEQLRSGETEISFNHNHDN